MRADSSRLCLFVATLAMLGTLAWMALRVNVDFGGDWTALFCTGDRHPIPPDLRPSTFIFKGLRGYDGQYYRMVAHDPFFQKGYAAFIDDSHYRYRRILVPMLAHVLAFGSDSRIEAAYVAVQLAAIFAGVFWSAAYVARAGLHPAWGLLFLLAPGTLASIDRMVVDGPLTALFAGFLVYAAADRFAGLWCVSCLAVLTRETGLILAVALVLYELWRRRYLRAGLVCLAPLPLLLWSFFVAKHTPAAMDLSVMVDNPVIGLFLRLFKVRAYPVLPRLFQTLDFLAMLGVIVSIGLAVYFIWRDRLGAGPIAAAFFVVLGLAVGNTQHLVETLGYSRPISPLLLYVMLRAVVTGLRWGLIPPLMVTLNVGIFYVSPLFNMVRALFRLKG